MIKQNNNNCANYFGPLTSHCEIELKKLLIKNKIKQTKSIYKYIKYVTVLNFNN